MRDKPKLFKRDGRWAVQLPAFGFAASPSVKGDFESPEDVMAWLRKRDEHTLSGGVFERTVTPSPAYYFGTDIWPVIVR